MSIIPETPFSVEKEFNNILEANKANKKFYVFVTDTAKPRLKKLDRIVHATNTAEYFISKLRKKLLKIEMLDMGINLKAKKPLSFLYIIDRG